MAEYRSKYRGEEVDALLDKIAADNVGDIDSALSLESENPVQNKVITEELNKKANKTDIATINGQPLTNGGNIEVVTDAYDDTEIKGKLTELSLKVGELEPASASALPEAVEGVTALAYNTTYGSPASPITLSGTMQIAYPTTTDHSEAVLYCVIAEGANITFNGTHYNEPSTDATTIIALARDNAWYFGAFQTV